MGLISILFQDPVSFFLLCILLLYSVILHEVAHGWVARLFGDNTAYYAGRLTLDPRSHVDPIGAIALLLVGFGWAKPVPVDFNNLRRPRLGLFCVSFAGIAANLTIATLAIIMLHLPVFYNSSTMETALVTLVRINIVLGAFNLIPIPPLDGAKIVMSFLSWQAQMRFASFERYGFFILIALLMTGMLDPVILFIQHILVVFITLLLRGILPGM